VETGGTLKVQRIVANVRAVDPALAEKFYGDILGLDLLFKKGGFEIKYGPVVEPWGVRRFFVRDPFGRLVNVLSHVDLSERPRPSGKGAA
jgi:catechol 2,3-dioxygenase-like lactoylglutathione lyase family enzyme